jgi:hypothetical protein
MGTSAKRHTSVKSARHAAHDHEAPPVHYYKGAFAARSLVWFSRKRSCHFTVMTKSLRQGRPVELSASGLDELTLHCRLVTLVVCL